ncbi:hypothetical protein PROFUN_02605, partial [Planoprotostelium fungivorum]
MVLVDPEDLSSPSPLEFGDDLSTSWLDDDLCLDSPLALSDSIGGVSGLSKKNVTTKVTPLSRVSASPRRSPRNVSKKVIRPVALRYSIFYLCNLDLPNSRSNEYGDANGTQLRPILRTPGLITPGSKVKKAAGTKSIPLSTKKENKSANEENRKNGTPSKGVQKKLLANRLIITPKKVLTPKKKLFKNPTHPTSQSTQQLLTTPFHANATGDYYDD